MRRRCFLILLGVLVLLCAAACAEVTEYDLYVGGIRVTSENCSSIKGDGISKTGTLSFDPSTNTLTIASKTVDSYYSKAAGSGAYAKYAGDYRYAIYSELPYLKLKMHGDCVVNACVYGRNIEVEGEGRLTVNASTGSSSCTAFACDTLTILPGGHLRVYNQTGSYGRTGLELGSRLDVQGSLEVSVTGGKPSYAVTWSQGALDVSISGTASLTASCPSNVTNGAFGLMTGGGRVQVSGTLQIDTASTGGTSSTGISCSGLILGAEADVVIVSKDTAVETETVTVPDPIKLLAGESEADSAPAEFTADALKVPYARLAKWQNNDLESPITVQLNTDISDSLSDKNESDYYCFTLPSAGVVQVTGSCGEETSGSWVVKIGSKDQMKERQSYRTSTFYGLLFDSFSKETVSPHLGLPAGTWYMRVQAGNGYSSLPYHVTIGFTPADDWETEPNDSWDKGDPVSVGETVKGALVQSSNFMLSTPTDWYRFTAQEEGYLTVTFQHEAADTDSICWDLSVYHADDLQQSVWWSPMTDSRTETFVSRPVRIPAGECGLKISAYTYASGGISYLDSDYSFSLRLEPLSAYSLVTFDDGQDGEGMKPVLVPAGEKYTLPECETEPPEGMVFSRWNAGLPGEEIDVTEDLTLTAVWKWEEVIPAPAFERNGLVLPADTAEIGESAFEGTDAVSVWIPDGCLSIGARAFANCEKLESIRIPGSVTRIDDTAFEGCGRVIIYGAAAQGETENEARRIAGLCGYQFVEE